MINEGSRGYKRLLRKGKEEEAKDRKAHRDFTATLGKEGQETRKKQVPLAKAKYSKGWYDHSQRAEESKKPLKTGDFIFEGSMGKKRLDRKGEPKTSPRSKFKVSDRAYRKPSPDGTRFKEDYSSPSKDSEFRTLKNAGEFRRLAKTDPGWSEDHKDTARIAIQGSKKKREKNKTQLP